MSVRFQFYKDLQTKIPQLYAEAREKADEIGIPKELRGKFGLTGSISGCPAPLREDILKATEAGMRQVIPLRNLVDEIRALVKEVYGDEYDAAPLSTCEAGLWLAFDVLCTPPKQGSGSKYRSGYVVPYERHLHHHGAYGRPVPPFFKDLFADRGSTAGELGFYAKRLENLDTVIVPLAGASYDCHGIKYHPVPLLLDVDPEKSYDNMLKAAQQYTGNISAVSSLGYGTPGYGYGVKDENGVPVLQKLFSKLAREMGVPYIVDCASGLPLAGADPRGIDADIMIYSMDKSTGSPTSGLIIGREQYMVPIRRALGMHGERWGTTTSYGKAGYVTFDPGKEALLGQIAALKVLRDNPEVVKNPGRRMLEIVKEEFSQLPGLIKDALIISPTSVGVEINYQRTWKNGKPGVPIFSIEDMYAGTSLIQTACSQMGVIPGVAYDANILISPGLGTTDEAGKLDEERTRFVVKALAAAVELVTKHAGVI